MRGAGNSIFFFLFYSFSATSPSVLVLISQITAPSLSLKKMYMETQSGLSRGRHACNNLVGRARFKVRD